MGVRFRPLSKNMVLCRALGYATPPPSLRYKTRELQAERVDGYLERPGDLYLYSSGQYRLNDGRWFDFDRTFVNGRCIMLAVRPILSPHRRMVR
jgi:hypothetical protein